MSVSVLLATCNSAKFLKPLVDSILCQTHEDIRLIARDDCSTDSTRDILENIDDPRFRMMPNDTPSGSAQGNFFAMLTSCDDDYIMFADADDVWMPDKIERTLDCMKRLESLYGKSYPLLVHTDLRVTNKNLRIISDSLFRYEKISPRRISLNHLLAQNVVTGCTVMINRPLRQFVHRQPEDSVMHDWWLALIASAFGEIEVVPEATVLYRQHGNNQVGAYNARDLARAADKFSKKGDISRTYASMFAQAGCFAETFKDQLSPRQLNICHAFAAMPYKSKAGKIETIFRYGFFKNTLLRNIGQLLVI